MRNQIYYNRTLKYTARELRNNRTKFENILWSVIRKQQIQNIQFYRQIAIGTFILDFYAKKIKLGIEVDGGYHSTKEMQLKDLNRNKYFSNLGIHMLHFSNAEIEFELSKVLFIIKNNVIDRLSYFYPPSLSKEGRCESTGVDGLFG